MKTYLYNWKTRQWLRSIPRKKPEWQWIKVEEVRLVSPEELAEIVKGIEFNE